MSQTVHLPLIPTEPIAESPRRASGAGLSGSPPASRRLSVVPRDAAPLRDAAGQRSAVASGDSAAPRDLSEPVEALGQALTGPTQQSRLEQSLPQLLNELQVEGIDWRDGAGLSRAGGAGPSDHKALRIGGQTVMVPIFTDHARRSRFTAEVVKSSESHASQELGPSEKSQRPGTKRPRALLSQDGRPLLEVEFPPQPEFYSRHTADGVPYWKIATLHSDDVLATTVLQTCTRYGHRETSCQFCAIGQSLAAKTTIAHKTPAQLAEVAEAAVRLDGVRHMVLTTGTPATDDRGAAVLAESARAIRAAVDLPIQAQCEPPADFTWFERLKEAGVDTLGLHLEAVSERVRQRIMPGKAEVSVATYLRAFERAVDVFGRGQVTTYILAGLGDTAEEIGEISDAVARRGVYPFVVPFVPIQGTPLSGHAPPTATFMDDVLGRVSTALTTHGLRSQDIHAGCGRCGACSTLRSREKAAGSGSSGFGSEASESETSGFGSRAAGGPGCA